MKVQEAAKVLLEAFPEERGPFQKTSIFSTSLVQEALRKLAYGEITQRVSTPGPNDQQVKR